MEKCKKCKNIINEGEKFCSNCGTEFKGNKKNLNKILCGTIIIVVIALITFISIRFIFNPASSPERTVKNFI